jgi:2-iminobutanoate/2-iminopropanoate deaminase
MKEVAWSEEFEPMGAHPYSLGIRAKGFVFCSGQTGSDPKTGELVAADVFGQTRQTLQNISSVLRAIGSSIDKVVKTTVFLTDIGDFARMNEAYQSFFEQDPPARSTVQVAALPTPGARVEIEAIAVE